MTQEVKVFRWCQLTGVSCIKGIKQVVVVVVVVVAAAAAVVLISLDKTNRNIFQIITILWWSCSSWTDSLAYYTG